VAPAEQSDEILRKRRFPTVLFLTIIFVPTIASMIAAQTDLEDLSAGTAIFGGCLSGCIAGPLLAARLGKTPLQKFVSSPFLMFVLGVACVTMNCAGCIASANLKIFRP
jgi:hypothetical protein